MKKTLLIKKVCILYTVKPAYSGHAIYRTPCNSGHFFVNWSSHGQTLIEKLLYRGHIYSGHSFLAPREMFKSNSPLDSGLQNVFIWHTYTHTHTHTHTHKSLLLYFVSYLLVSLSEFSITFAGTNFDRIVPNTQNSRNLLPLKTI